MQINSLSGVHANESIHQLKLGIDAAKTAGGVVEAVLCYSDVADPKKTKYTLKYYMDFVDQLVAEGIHVLGIKYMAGILKPQAATMSASRRIYLTGVLANPFDRLAVWLGPFARSTPACLSTFTRTTPLVSPFLVCWLPLQRVPTSSMLPLTVSVPSFALIPWS